MEGDKEIKKIITENVNISKQEILNKLFLYAAQTTPRNASLLNFRGNEPSVLSKNKSLTPSISRRIEQIFNTYLLHRALFSHKYIQIFTLNYRKNDQTICGIFELMGQRGELDDDIIDTLNIYGRIHIKVNIVRMLDEYKKALEKDRSNNIPFDFDKWITLFNEMECEEASHVVALVSQMKNNFEKLKFSEENDDSILDLNLNFCVRKLSSIAFFDLDEEIKVT